MSKVKLLWSSDFIFAYIRRHSFISNIKNPLLQNSLPRVYWAHIDTVYYAATDEDVLKYGKFQDNEFWNEMKKPEDQIKIKSINIGREEATKVWREYEDLNKNKVVPDY